MNKITPLSIYIINQVRLKRLILGISARYLSILLEHGETYVSNIESALNENQYPPHEYPKLAEALNCTVHDLLPPDEMDQDSTGKLVDKVVLSLSNESDLRLVIDRLIAYGFFDHPKALEDISKHLFIEKQEQVDLLFEVLSRVVKTGDLKQRVLDYYREMV